jgi:hypothetical protein
MAVWHEAENFSREQEISGASTQEMVARAIMAERERCAKIAREFFPPAHTYASENADIYHAQDSAAAAIANAINPSPAADPPRGDNISPSPLGAAGNDDFKRVQVLGPVR